MADPPPLAAPPRFPEYVLSQLQQHQYALTVSALALTAWLLLSELLRCYASWRLRRDSASLPPLRDSAELTDGDDVLGNNGDEELDSISTEPPRRGVKAEITSDDDDEAASSSALHSNSPVKRKQSSTPHRRRRRVYNSPSPTISDNGNSFENPNNSDDEAAMDRALSHAVTPRRITRATPSRAPKTPHRTAVTPRPTMTPTTLRLTGISLPPPRFPNSPYIRLSPPPSPPSLTPGTLVLRPRPTHFPTDPSTHDGPFILISTANPAPPHLRHSKGASLASWAEIDLPKGSRAERWYKENELLEYTGPLTKERVRELAEEKEGMYVMHLLRGDRVRAGKTEYRVAWRGWPCEDDTWETAKKVKSVDDGLIGEYEVKKKGW